MGLFVTLDTSKTQYHASLYQVLWCCFIKLQLCEQNIIIMAHIEQDAQRGMVSTFDLLVLTSTAQLLFILKLHFSFLQNNLS
jgi:hypothetical protein